MNRLPEKPILIVGIFYHKQHVQKNYITAAQQLADLFYKNKMEVIVTSYVRSKPLRLVDTLSTILHNAKKFDIAILPLYGTALSFLWQEANSRLLKFLNKKIILVVHGGSIPQRMEKTPKKFLKALRRADAIVAPSPFMQHELNNHHIASTVIENVLNVSKYKPVEKKIIKPHIIWMRAFENIYNPLMAVRVANILAKKYDDFKMLMAGSDKGNMNEVKALIGNYNLQNKILLPGYINNKQKQKIAEEYDIFINTNYIDNAPVSVIEFMALKVPVIAVAAGGIPYLIADNKNGMLVAPDDDEAMAEKISILIEQPQLAEKIIDNAFQFSKKFDEQPVLQKWLTLLATV